MLIGRRVRRSVLVRVASVGQVDGALWSRNTVKVLPAAETFLCASASRFSFVPPFSALFHSLYFLSSNFTAVSPLYGPSGVSLATRSTVLRS